MRQLGRTDGADGEAAGVDEVATTAGGAIVVATWEATAGAEDAGGGGGADFWGAMHCVQMVEVTVLMTVEVVLVTCTMGVP